MCRGRTGISTEPWVTPPRKARVGDVEPTQRPEKGQSERWETIVFLKPERSRNMKELTSVTAVSLEGWWQKPDSGGLSSKQKTWKIKKQRPSV